jgi:hypothetical protein
MPDANLFHGLKQADNPSESRRLWVERKQGIENYRLYLSK